MQDLGEHRMAVKVWHIKGLLKEIKVHHCHTCSPIISLWQVSAFNHNSASENRAMFPITIAVTLQILVLQVLRIVTSKGCHQPHYINRSPSCFSLLIINIRFKFKQRKGIIVWLWCAFPSVYIFISDITRCILELYLFKSLFKCLCSLLQIGILIPIAIYNVQTYIKTNKPQKIREMLFIP